MARNYSSVVEPKTLTGTVSSSATQITLNNVTGLPSPPYILVLNPDTAKEEAVLVTVDQSGVTSPTLKVTRAVEASGGAGTAQDHTIGDTVKHMIVGSDLQIVHDHFSNESTTAGTAHGATGGVVGRTNSQTLTNKTINLTDNTLTGTFAQFNTALSDADFATATTVSTNTPVGSITMYGGTTAPTGWLLCNGAAIPSQHTALIALVGANTPDLMGRVPVGYGQGSGLTNRLTMFDKSGAENVTLTVDQIPSHQHGTAISGGSSFNMTGSSTAGSFANWFAGNSSNSTVVTDNLIGGGNFHPNMQPFTVVQFIIKH